jgi:chemotaxis protein methyltransferase CheR
LPWRVPAIATDLATAPALPVHGRLRRADFARLAAFIEDYAGIKMPPSKTTMLEGRLHRRVRALDLANLDAYCRYLFEQDGLRAESVHLIDAVSTNKTDFFREPEQFRLLRARLLPAWRDGPDAARPGRLRAWSSACSTGAEPYTLAMVLAEFVRDHAGAPAEILATDISTDVLATARRGIYPQSMAEPIPPPLRARYLLRSRDRARGLVRMAPPLRAMVRFGRFNLMDAAYDLGGAFDLVFCRNVLIYFGRETQAAVLRRLCGQLRRGGALFLGHSESIGGLGLPLTPLGANVFQRT